MGRARRVDPAEFQKAADNAVNIDFAAKAGAGYDGFKEGFGNNWKGSAVKWLNGENMARSLGVGGLAGLGYAGYKQFNQGGVSPQEAAMDVAMGVGIGGAALVTAAYGKRLATGLWSGAKGIKHGISDYTKQAGLAVDSAKVAFGQ